MDQIDRARVLKKIMFKYLVVYLIVVTGLSIVDTASVLVEKILR